MPCSEDGVPPGDQVKQRMDLRLELALRVKQVKALQVLAQLSGQILDVILVRHELARVQRRQPDNLASQFQRDVYRMMVQPADRMIECNASIDRKIGLVGGDLRAVGRGHKMVLDDNRPHPHLFGLAAQLDIVEDTRVHVRGGVNVHVHCAFEQAHHLGVES